MNPAFDENDTRYLREHIARSEQDMLPASAIPEISDKCRGIVLGTQTAADHITQAAILALQNRKPFSAVRLGDAEGNIIGCCDPTLDIERELKWFNVALKWQSGSVMSLDEAKTFASQMEAAFCDADVLGLRMFVPFALENWPFGLSAQWANKLIDEKSDLRGAHGVLRSDELPLRWLREGALQHTTLIHAWYHTPLLDRLDQLVAAAETTIFINGRQELSGPLKARFPKSDIDFIPIPAEPPKPGELGPMHYPDAFQNVLHKLDRDLAGSLVLVGAGIIGKIYCHAAKKSGAVVIDIGSAFDLLAGIHSRVTAQTAADVERYRML